MTVGVCDMQKEMKKEEVQETKEFLKQFYESPEVEEDTISAKLKRTLMPKGKKTKAIADFAKDLMGEGGAGDVVIDDDMFETDTESYKQQEKKRLSKRTRVSLFLLLVAIPLTIAAGFWLTDQSVFAQWIDDVFGPRKYYLISLVIVLYALLPFFMAFEGRKPEVRELVVLATMIALATAGRAAFFMTPSFKPIIAIVIVSAVAFGAEAGFLVGSMTMLVSNFLFGQGPWTPWQMFCWGLLGFLAGVLGRMGLFGPVGRTAADEKGKRKKPVALCIYGFAGGFLYGWIMNIYYIIGWVRPFSWKAAGAAYVSSFFFDLSHGICTALVLWLVGEAWVRKLLRIRKKFGLTGEVRRYELPPSFRAMEGEHP